jgi:2,3-diketo-5-methylthio-1-phosphopentane phosphatase
MKFIFKIFTDFDGTITNVDVGDSAFRKFGEQDKVNKIITKLLNDEISAKESWESLCSSVGRISKIEFDRFVDSIEIDQTFHSFVDYCRTNNIDLYVLSDGFDYYIERIFKNENIAGVKVYSNKLEFSSEGKLIPSFPYLDAEWTTSANCKRNHIISHSGDSDYTIFIGDGNSDKYTAQFCDFIFAKDDLLKFCERERITYFPFKDFQDIILKIDQLASKKRLKKRHQAELKRKEAYMTE